MFPARSKNAISLASLAVSALLIAQGSAPGCRAATGHQLQARSISRAEVMQVAKGLSNPSAAIRTQCLKQLAAWGPDAAPAVPAIIEVFNENRSGLLSGGFANRYSPAVTSAAVEALKQIGPAARDAAPYLVQLLDDQNEFFRRDSVLQALERTGLDDSSTATIMLVVNQEGKFTKTRNLAIRLLGLIEPPATDAVELLNSIASDTKDTVGRQEALAALASITKRASARDGKQERTAKTDQEETLRAGLSAGNSKNDRLDALHKIADLGPQAGYMVPRLMQLVNDPDPEIRHTAVVALGAVGPQANTALPLLITRLFGEHDDDERRSIARAISSIDETGRRAVPMLQPALEDPFKARVAIIVLEELGTEESNTLAQKVRLRWHIK